MLPRGARIRHPTERAVWDALQALPDDAAVFANRCFTDRKGDCEADLIVAIPDAGIAVIEVKGGRVDHDGTTWRQTGGAARSKAIDPVGQGKRSKYALRSYLDQDPRWRRRRARFAHLVAFPATSVPADVNPTDCPRWMVVDRDQTDSAGRIAQDVLTSQQDANPLIGRPGLYAWWAVPGSIPKLEHRAGGGAHPTASPELELIYVGIASDLHKRIVRSHLGTSTGGSTLRRTLAALVGSRPHNPLVAKWRPGDTGRTIRGGADGMDERVPAHHLDSSRRARHC